MVEAAGLDQLSIVARHKKCACEVNSDFTVLLLLRRMRQPKRRMSAPHAETRTRDKGD
jgi:hypothetical protein